MLEIKTIRQDDMTFFIRVQSVSICIYIQMLSAEVSQSTPDLYI